MLKPHGGQHGRRGGRSKGMHTHSGAAFVRYRERDAAVAAIGALGGAVTMQGGHTPLFVRFAHAHKRSTGRGDGDGGGRRQHGSGAGAGGGGGGGGGGGSSLGRRSRRGRQSNNNSNSRTVRTSHMAQHRHAGLPGGPATAMPVPYQDGGWNGVSQQHQQAMMAAAAAANGMYGPGAAAAVAAVASAYV